MTQIWILYPLIAMVILTFFVGMRMLLLRIRAVRTGELSLGYFRTNQGGEVPNAVTQTTQHYDNLFEMPVLFYVIVIVLYVTASVDLLQLVLAWCFVILRMGHAYVHITYNNVVHRLYMFLASSVAVLAMWFIWFGKTILS